MTGWECEWYIFAVCMDAREGSFQGGEGTRAEAGVGEDLAEVGWSV